MKRFIGRIDGVEIKRVEAETESEAKEIIKAELLRMAMEIGATPKPTEGRLTVEEVKE